MSPESLLAELSRWFPLLDELENTEQDASWHAEGNVYIHTLMVIEQVYQLLDGGDVEFSIEEQVGLIVGAVLHDIAKPLTTRKEEIAGKMRIVSPRHAERGQSYIGPLIGELGLTDRERAIVMAIVRHHHDPRQLVANSAPKQMYTRLARAISPKLLYYFERCDNLGRICRDLDAQIETIDLFKMEAENFSVFDHPKPYSQWSAFFEAEVSDPIEREFVYAEAIRLYEQGEINSPEEALGKTWQHRSDYGTVTILSAPSGTGKSSWIANHQDEVRIVSLDELREEIAGRRGDQSKNGQVLQLAKQRLKEGLRKKENIIWDSTGLRRDSRSMVSGLAHDYHALSRIVTLAAPPTLAKNRNRKRQHAIPEAVLEKQYHNWQWPDVWEAHYVDTYYTI